jgi:hypothetical protein
MSGQSGDLGSTDHKMSDWSVEQGRNAGSGAKGAYGASVGQDKISVTTDQSQAPPQGQQTGATRTIKGGSSSKYGG